MNSCSCLTLILACIIYWQAKQITQTVPSGAVAEEGIDATPAPTRQPDRMGNVILYGQYVLDSRPGPLATDSYVVFLQQSGRYPNHAGMVPGPNPVCGNVRHRIFHPVRRFSSDSYCPDAACPVLLSMDFMEGLTRNSCASSASRLVW